MDRVLVPVKLTDEMRERMGHIEDGPAKSHDEVWAEMLDAAYTPPRGIHDSIWMDLRHLRADQLTHHVMSVIDKYICEHDPVRKGHSNVARDLFDLFYKSGIEVITDEQRSAAGLPPRDQKGWTPQELAFMEARRLETMRSPTLPVQSAAPGV